VRNVLAGIGGLVAVIIIIGVAANSGGSTPGAANSGATQTATQAAAPAATQAASSAPAAQAAKPAAKTVATFSGNGIQNTPKFTVSSTWKLGYSFNCSSMGTSGNFIVMEDGSFGGLTVNALAESKSGSTYAYNDAGTHYLEINSECDWTVRVVDEG
jgi:hypothetical protein